MIILIHGEDTTASRNKLLEVKEKYKDAELVTLDGRNLALSNVVTVFDSPSLFQIKKILIVERFFTGVLPKEKISILSYLTKDAQLGSEVIFWEEKELEKTQIKRLGTEVKELKFPLPPLLFRFLDMVGTEPSSRLLSEFHTLLNQKEAELIYALLLRHVRNLIIAKDLGMKGFGAMPSWQSGKFIRQASTQTLTDLIGRYRKLLYIDYQIKTGQTPLSLPQLLDIFFVSL